MCGIAGFFSTQSQDSAARLREVAAQMARPIRHRGPDDCGTWADEHGQIAFGHKRLSVIDVSPEGHQPMASESGRYVIAYNGEIYNFREIREELRKSGRKFRGHSDTEVLLAAFEQYGLERAIRSFVGMFAFALWDSRRRVLTLARDRIGEKPLYFGWQEGVFLFASELKALKAHPAFSPEIDRGALALFLRHNCIPAPHSIYSGIRKLMPGHVLQVAVNEGGSVGRFAESEYWSLDDAIAHGMARPLDGTPEQVCDAVEAQLLRSVKDQMVSDVPLGAFLSGGIDSSLVVSLMQAQASKPVATFTIGSDIQDYDEAVQAKRVAKHLGTSHTELYVSPGDALSVIPDLPQIYCEPFSDSSQIPTYLVSRLASEHVTVALSGDGADEFFGGYNRYLVAQAHWSRLRGLPSVLRSGIARALTGLRPATWDKLFDGAYKLLPKQHKPRMAGDKIHKLASVLSAAGEFDYYHRLVSHWREPSRTVIDSTEPDTALSREAMASSKLSFVPWMMASDARTYLPDDILVKVDRAAMFNSLETRAPYLDHRLVELAWRIPHNLHFRNGESKWLLRQILQKYVPREFVDRPKMGFGIPLHEWLRGALREWAEDLLSENRLRREGFFDPVPVRQLWEAHLSGTTNEQYLLWDVLMFQAWLDRH